MNKRYKFELNADFAPILKKRAKKIGKSIDWLVNDILTRALFENDVRIVPKSDINPDIEAWFNKIPLNERVYKVQCMEKCIRDLPHVAKRVNIKKFVMDMILFALENDYRIVEGRGSAGRWIMFQPKSSIINIKDWVEIYCPEKSEKKYHEQVTNIDGDIIVCKRGRISRKFCTKIDKPTVLPEQEASVATQNQ